MDVLPAKRCGYAGFEVDPVHKLACWVAKLIPSQKRSAAVERHPDRQHPFGNLAIAAAETRRKAGGEANFVILIRAEEVLYPPRHDVERIVLPVL